MWFYNQNTWINIVFKLLEIFTQWLSKPNLFNLLWVCYYIDVLSLLLDEYWISTLFELNRRRPVHLRIHDTTYLPYSRLVLSYFSVFVHHKDFVVVLCLTNITLFSLCTIFQQKVRKCSNEYCEICIRVGMYLAKGQFKIRK